MKKTLATLLAIVLVWLAVLSIPKVIAQSTTQPVHVKISSLTWEDGTPFQGSIVMVRTLEDMTTEQVSFPVVNGVSEWDEVFDSTTGYDLQLTDLSGNIVYETQTVGSIPVLIHMQSISLTMTLLGSDTGNLTSPKLITETSSLDFTPPTPPLATAVPPPTPGTTFTLAPISIDYGTIQSGTVSNNIMVNITNTSSVNRLYLTSLTFTGDPMFRLKSFCSEPSSFSPTYGCGFWVTFVPTQPGTFSGTMVVQTDGAGPNVVTLTGTAQ